MTKESSGEGRKIRAKMMLRARGMIKEGMHFLVFVIISLVLVKGKTRRRMTLIVVLGRIHRVKEIIPLQAIIS